MKLRKHSDGRFNWYSVIHGNYVLGLTDSCGIRSVIARELKEMRAKLRILSTKETI